MSSLEDYILLMLCMKSKGKKVDFNHIYEKVRRDLKEKSKEKVENILEKLEKDGHIQIVNGKYSVNDKGRTYFAGKLPAVEKQLAKINFAYLTVYKAKRYHPVVGETILEFCKNRHVGFYCVFTERHFFRRQFGGKYIVLNNMKDLMSYVGIHYIDVIPCVHRINSKRPDWLVVDLDAGEEVSFEQTKKVAEVVYKTFEQLDLKPALKFSGSRGFQIWSWLGDFEIPKRYEPLELPGGTKRSMDYFTLFADFIHLTQREVEKKIPGLTTSHVGGKEERKDKVLLDPSSMKENGLVRAPYTIHHKTGLVSVPVKIKELKKFVPEDATVENVIRKYKKNEFKLEKAGAEKLLELII